MSQQGQVQEGNRKPDSNETISPSDLEMGEEENLFEDESFDDTSEGDSQESTDDQKKRSSGESLDEDESVSKYNFIFYLLYKFKYDTAP